MNLKFSYALVILLLLSGCFYKTPVQQGNILDQKDIDLVKPGMSKQQVAIILGTPSIADPFNKNRWDYISTAKIKGKLEPIKKFSAYFENDKLIKTEGNYYPQSSEVIDENENEN